MDQKIGAVLDTVRSSRMLLDEISRDSAVLEEKVKLIRAATDIGILNIGGQLLAILDVSMMMINGALQGMEESVVDAEKQIARSAYHDAEARVAREIQDTTEHSSATEDTLDALGQAKSRVEEAREFGRLCADRIDILNKELPQLKI